MRETSGGIQKSFFTEKDKLEIQIVEKFIGERGRINCSLKEKWLLEMAWNTICNC